jgi:iron complex outermembrane recepter protein
MFFRKLLMIAPALLWGTTIFAQSSLSGTVSDEISGQPLQEAHVLLQDSYRQTTSAADGSFNFHKLKAGTYTVRVSYIGYETGEKTISINGPLHLDIMLLRKTIMEDEVIIRSTRAGDRTPVTYQNISHDNLVSKNMGQDLPVLVSLSPSIVTTSDAGNGVGYTAMRIRGTDMSRINVTLNGIPLNDAESHDVYWVDLPDVAASVDNLQIQRGVGTSTNGAAAFGASLNLQTSSLHADPYAEVSSAYGSFNTIKNSAIFGTGLLNKCLTFDGRFSKVQSDGYIDRASSDLKSWFISSGYYSHRTIVKFNMMSGTEKTYQAWNGIPGEILDTNRTYNEMGKYTDAYGHVKFYDNETDNYQQDHYQLLFSHQLNEHLYANAALHYTKGKGYYEEYRDEDNLSDYGIRSSKIPGHYVISGNDSTYLPDSLISNSDLIRRKYLNNDFYGATYSLNYAKGQWKLTFGGSWNNYEGRHYGTVIWARYAGDSEIGHRYYESTGRKEDFNLFTKAGYDLSEKVHLFGDLQYRQVTHHIDGIDDDQRDITQKHTYKFFNPKAGIFLQLTPSSDCYASVAVANREPNRSNFTDANPAGPVPGAETLYDFESGYSLQTNFLKLEANLFVMLYHDQLVLTGAINDVGAAVMTNVPESYRTGIELSSKTRLSGFLTWDANLTLSRNKIKRFTELVDNWDDGTQQAIEHSNTNIAFSPGIIASSQFIATPLHNFSISFTSKYVGKQFIDNTGSNDRMLNAYLLNDLQFAYEVKTRFFRKATFSLLIGNLFNEQYESNAWVYRYTMGGTYGKLDGYFPQAGRNAMVALNIGL